MTPGSPQAGPEGPRALSCSPHLPFGGTELCCDGLRCLTDLSDCPLKPAQLPNLAFLPIPLSPCTQTGTATFTSRPRAQLQKTPGGNGGSRSGLEGRHENILFHGRESWKRSRKSAMEGSQKRAEVPRKHKQPRQGYLEAWPNCRSLPFQRWLSGLLA